jgi:hypothetical protein
MLSVGWQTFKIELTLMKPLIFLTALITFTINSFGQDQNENLKIVWPEEYKWKVASNQEDKTVHFLEIVPGKESIEKWTMLGTMMSLKNIRISSADQVVEMYRQTSLKESSKAKLTVIEKNNATKNIWVLFKVETPSFPNDPRPESQLFYAIQGKATLYVSFIAIKEKTLTEDFIKKWTQVFRGSELVYE